MPLLGLGEAAGEFIEVAGADQAALGGVIAGAAAPSSYQSVPGRLGAGPGRASRASPIPNRAVEDKLAG